MANNREVSELKAQLEVLYAALADISAQEKVKGEELAEISAQGKVNREQLANIRAAHTAKLQEARVLSAQLQRLRDHRIAELYGQVDEIRRRALAGYGGDGPAVENVEPVERIIEQDRGENVARNVGVRGGHVEQRDDGGVGGGSVEQNEVGGFDDEMECIIQYKNHHRYALPLPNHWKSFVSAFSTPVRVQRGLGGPAWNVELLGANISETHGLFMYSGWENFVADNDVEHGDILSVRYVGQGVFHIQVLTVVDDDDDDDADN